MDELVRQLIDRTPLPGVNRSEWRGLRCYRFEHPQVPQWGEAHSLALCVVVQGRKRVRFGGDDYFYDPFNCFVMTRRMRFQAEVLEATPSRPFLSLLLEIDPEAVRHVAKEMHRGSATPIRRPARAPREAFVTPFDHNLMGALARFLRSLSTEADRSVLAPIYLQEIVYRILQTEQWGRIAEAAVHEAEHHPVSVAIRFMRENLSRPVSVAELADAVAMSQSAFAHLFKSVVGVSPYQFSKRLRLDAARALLIENAMTVSEAGSAVGYTSPSHFITDFKRSFGVTPRAYAEALRDPVPAA